MENTNVENKITDNVESEAKVEEQKVAEPIINKTEETNNIKETPIAEEVKNEVQEEIKVDDPITKENIELKNQLKQIMDTLQKVDSDYKTKISKLENDMSKLRKANEFTSTTNSHQQNKKGNAEEFSVEDILKLRSRI